MEDLVLIIDMVSLVSGTSLVIVLNPSILSVAVAARNADSVNKLQDSPRYLTQKNDCKDIELSFHV